MSAAENRRDYRAYLARHRGDSGMIRSMTISGDLEDSDLCLLADIVRALGSRHPARRYQVTLEAEGETAEQLRALLAGSVQRLQ